MKINLLDIPEIRAELLPLTFTRPCGELPLAFGTIREHWQRLMPQAEFGYVTEEYLGKKFPKVEAEIIVSGHYLPSAELAKAIANLKPGEWIADSDGECIARRGDAHGKPTYTHSVQAYRKVTDIFRLNKELIVTHFNGFTLGRVSAPVSETCTVIGSRDSLFIEPGADVEGVIFDLRTGPIYIGENSEIQPGAILRGPIYIGPNCRVRSGAKLLPGTNLGPSTRVGGEISNAIFLGYSNKQHDGFLGDAVIGQWCNLGAGCVASNLKNDYSEIKLWNYPAQRFVRTGLQFCGLIMGDHCKAGINTMFNTATTVSPGCNIHGAGFPRPYIAPFTDGGVQAVSRVIFSKFISTATEMMRHRNIAITSADIEILEHLYNL